jgi:hypothetical protein
MSNPYQQVPGGYPNQPPASNTGRTLLVVFGVIGGIFVVTLLICAGVAYYAIVSVKETISGLGEEFKKMAAAEQKAEREYWVSVYKDHPLVQEHVGTISNSRDIDKGINAEPGMQVHKRLELTGDKGTAELVIESQAWSMEEEGFESTLDTPDSPDASKTDVLTAPAKNLDPEKNADPEKNPDPATKADSAKDAKDVELEVDEMIFEEDVMKAYLVVHGEKMLLDDQALQKYENFDFDYDWNPEE